MNDCRTLQLKIENLQKVFEIRDRIDVSSPMIGDLLQSQNLGDATRRDDDAVQCASRWKWKSG